MTQTTIIELGSAESTSSDIVVAAGQIMTIAIFSGVQRIHSNAYITVRQDTPSVDNFVCRLDGYNRSYVLVGPGTYRAYRPDISATSQTVGAFTED